MDLGLRGRTFVVTGGTKGLGYACAEELVRDGAKVVVSSRSEQSVTEAVEALGGKENAEGVAADLSDPATTDRLIGCALDAFGRIDGALINTGGPPPGSELGHDDEAWRQAFESVYLGPLRLARSLLEKMDSGGSLVFVLSSSVRTPLPGLGLSNGLRPGLAMAAKSLANQAGPRGVRVNGLLPGKISTDRLRGYEESLRASGQEPQYDNIPLRRTGDPAEFGRIAAFVLSPAASYLSGTMIPVDGGLAPSL